MRPVLSCCLLVASLAHCAHALSWPWASVAAVSPSRAGGAAAGAGVVPLSPPRAPSFASGIHASSVEYATLSVSGRYATHNPACTEGLAYAEGSLYISEGVAGVSQLLRVDADSGTVRVQLPLAQNDVFAEGIALLYNSSLNTNVIYQLTYRHRMVLRYADQTDHFEPLEQMQYAVAEGWGE